MMHASNHEKSHCVNFLRVDREEKNSWMKWAASKSDVVKGCRLVSMIEINSVHLVTCNIYEERIVFLLKLGTHSSRPSFWKTLHFLINRHFWLRDPCCKRCLIGMIKEVINLKVWLDIFRWGLVLGSQIAKKHLKCRWWRGQLVMALHSNHSH